MKLKMIKSRKFYVRKNESVVIKRIAVHHAFLIIVDIILPSLVIHVILLLL